ncbi:hypothetical protein BHE74_00044609, partial [Ensete ventricosum]
PCGEHRSEQCRGSNAVKRHQRLCATQLNRGPAERNPSYLEIPEGSLRRESREKARVGGAEDGEALEVAATKIREEGMPRPARALRAPPIAAAMVTFGPLLTLRYFAVA